MDTQQTRRDFLRAACAPCLLAIAGITITSCDSGPAGGDGGTGGGNGGGNNNLQGITISGNTITIDLTNANTSSLNSPGTGLVIAPAATIVANDGGTIRAFTWTCTHQGGQLSTFQNNRFVCNNHGSLFNTAGVPVDGEAVPFGPLKEFNAVRNGDTVTITKS
jgi:cytochrome b6-f complex iron-sulfur subunit